MKVVCPNCETQNQIDKDNIIRCGNCSQTFPDDLYAKESFFKKLTTSKKAITTSIIAGAIIGYSIENKLDDNRYPIEYEYQIIANCAGNSYSSRYVEQCVCALKETLKSVKFDEIDSKFRNHFQSNLKARKCSR